MVREVLPSYYAANTLHNIYELRGGGFDLIPAGALGLLARDNDNPLEYLSDPRGWRLFDMTEKTDSRIVMVPEVDDTHAAPTYLGAIVSHDFSEVYWVNNTKPLPV